MTTTGTAPVTVTLTIRGYSVTTIGLQPIWLEQVDGLVQR